MAKESAGSLAAQPIGAVMLRTTNPQHSLWEAILPDACLGLPAERARVDTLLDDPAFLAPLAAHFDPRLGRPSIPLDTYLRMMFLKFRYRLGYELLCREVTDSISWQRFCRIPLGAQVPHATTLVKLTRRLGEQTVAALNQALLASAAEHKVLRTHRCGPTPPWSPRMWPTRPTPGCWPARSASSPPRSVASRPPAGPAAPGSGTAAAPPAAAPTSSPGPCGAAPSRPNRRCCAPPGSWPTSPSGRWPTPPGSPATPAAGLVAPATRP